MLDFTAFMWSIRKNGDRRLFVAVRTWPEWQRAMKQVLKDHHISSSRAANGTLRLYRSSDILAWAGLVYCPPALQEKLADYHEACELQSRFRLCPPDVQERQRKASVAVLNWVEQFWSPSATTE